LLLVLTVCCLFDFFIHHSGIQLIPDYSKIDCKASEFGCLLGGTVIKWYVAGGALHGVLK
jgi:hypothetical protein